MKEVMTSFDIAAIAAELRESILGASINNLYQLTPKTILLRLHRPDLKLILELGRRINISKYEVEIPERPSNFTMVLRRHLRDGHISKIEQTEFDRVVEIEVRTAEGERTVVVELFSKGNLILTGPDGRILLASTYKKMRDRNILAGEQFHPAPATGINFLKARGDYLVDLRKFGSLELVKGLAKLLGLGGLYSEEALVRAGVDKMTPCASLSEESASRILEALESLKAQLKNLAPVIVVESDDRMIDVLPFPLKSYEDKRTTRFETFNDAADEYFTKLSVEETAERGAGDAQTLIAEQERIKDQQTKQVEEIKRDAVENQEIGNAIFGHLNEIEDLLSRLRDQRRSGIEWEEIIEGIKRDKEEGKLPASYFLSITPEESLVTLALEGRELALDFTRTASENAAVYYEKGKKAKSKIEGLRKAMEETEKKMRERQLQKRAAVEESQRAVKERERAWYEKFHWFRSSEGFLVVAGKDATSNEVLFKKYMEQADIVLHTELPGAPFTVIKTEGKEVDVETIKEAAEFSVSYSRAWREKLTEADIYWVKPEQVSKTPPSGEYITKGKFVMRGDRNYLHHTRLGIAIGIKELEGETEILSGPIEAVKKETRLFVEIVPGDRKSKELAHKIRGFLAHRAPENLRAEILRHKEEEFQRYIPGGTGEISK